MNGSPKASSFRIARHAFDVGLMSNLQWTFRNGRLAHHEIGRGKTLFDDSYRTAGREKDRPGVLLIGLNPEIRDFPLAEDQESGVVTVEIGHNEDFGGRTRGTFRSFATLRGADLYVDDELLLRRGRRI